jgi:hypothetical protein
MPVACLAQAPAPAPPPPAPTKPAPAPKPVNEAIKDQFTLSVFYWKPDGAPGFRAGQSVADPQTRYLDLVKPSRAAGLTLTFPTGSFNRLEIGAWRASDTSTVVAPHRLLLYGANIREGDRLDTTYRTTNIRAAWNYLTWPAPPFGAKFRVKTFWEIQYTQFTSQIGFPDARNNPEPIRPKQSVWYPGAGLGFEYVPSKYFRIDARGSGMAFPSRSGYYDVEANIVGRFKMVEVFAGGKLFHYHGSPKKSDTYIQQTLWGPLAGIRWVIF